MRIAAIQRTSFVDYPGKLATVVFTPGCNLDCFYCHNRTLLVTKSNTLTTKSPSRVLEYLSARRGLIDGVVLSGGEPTLQSGLIDFIRAVRTMGYPIKLDTNGTRPVVLASLLEAGLVNYVAMDIKAPVEKYDSICGASIDQGSIDNSIELLISGHIEYEFRTTIVPQLTREDIMTIAHRIRGANSYVLQRYRHVQVADPSRQAQSSFRRCAPSWLEDIWYYLNQTVKSCYTRGFEIGCAQPD